MTLSSDHKLINGFAMTVGWLQGLLEEKFQQKPKVTDITPLGKDILGFMSLIKRIYLEWPKEDEKLPKSLVLKCACSQAVADSLGEQAMDDLEATMDVLQKAFHNNELSYIAMFNEGKQQVSDLTVRAPFLYGGGDFDSSTPCILMKDYGDCTLVDLIEGFNEKQLYEIVDQLVELQSFSLTTTKWREIQPSPEYVAMIEGFGAQMKMVAEKLRMEQPEMFADVIGKFMDNTFRKDEQWFVAGFQKYLGQATGVLIHGDFWAPQILWRGNKIEVVVDWQASRNGNPGEDLLRILATCVSVENRRNLAKKLFEYHYEKLVEKTTEKGGKVPFTKEEFMSDCKEAALPVAMVAIFANAIWANSSVLKVDGQVDVKRTTESFGRCRAFLEDIMKVHGW